METETVICDVCGFTAYNFGSSGTRYLRCSGCVPNQGADKDLSCPWIKEPFFNEVD